MRAHATCDGSASRVATYGTLDGLVSNISPRMLSREKLTSSPNRFSAALSLAAEPEVFPGAVSAAPGIRLSRWAPRLASSSLLTLEERPAAPAEARRQLPLHVDSSSCSTFAT